LSGKQKKEKVADVDKIKMRLLEYDRDKKIILVEIEEPFSEPYKAEKKGLTVDEFKALVRKKHGEKVDIINLIKKNRTPAVIVDDSNWNKHEDNKYNTKDIMEAMRNDNMKLGR
jgi:hypothetical protein